MMRSLFCIFALLAALTFNSMAQREADWGVTAGTSTYLGEINPDGLFVLPSPAAGLFYRYNIHPRHSLRASVSGFGIRGDDMVSSNQYQLDRGESFSGFLGEMSVLFEFNLFPYTTEGFARKLRYTPYMAAGVGVSFINTVAFTYTPVIPLVAGIKFNFYKNLGLELEYGFRKTFYDNFDGLIDPVDPDHGTWTHNNDWYTFAGVSFTWKMFNRLAGCPAYEEQTNKRRRP
jgi:hypothetical protein